MPSKSKAQANLMAGIAHGWKPTGMKNPPSKAVAKEFNAADAKQHMNPLSGIALATNSKAKGYCDGGAVRGRTRGKIV